MHEYRYRGRARLLRQVTILLLMTSWSVPGQLREESMLLGCVRNETTHREYDGIHSALHRLLADVPQFPRTILDTTVRADSFPDEASLIRAREMNAAYMMWGVVDSGGTGTGITIDLLDMGKGSVAHIRISIARDESRNAVTETVRSKLQLWLQRTMMAQLIVTTAPPAAAVLLDDRQIGETPFEGMLHPGSYRLELTKKGLLPVRIPVSFISGNTYQYDITLGTIGKRMDKRPIFRWLGVSAVCLGGGCLAHWQRSRAQEQYRKATPPDDFDQLYNRAVAWDVGRDVLFTAAGAALVVVIVKAVF